MESAVRPHLWHEACGAMALAGKRCRVAFFAVLYITNALPGMQKLLCFTLLFFILTVSGAYAQQKSTGMNTYNYAKAWTEVKDFEGRGLPESALTVVNTIYTHAKQEQNAAELVKAVIHRLKFVNEKEENAFVKNLNIVREEARNAEYPVKPVLHSMLGELYWQYYTNNRYRFRNRTAVVNASSDDDIETWSLDKIVEETLGQYDLSLESAEQSKRTPINIYEPILERGNEKGRSFHPTLYDFLAQRAVTFYSFDEASLTRPAAAFSLDDERYLADSKTFAALKLETTDTLSLKFHALVVLQELTRFHSTDADPSALVMVDLQRLRLVKDNFSLPTGNTLYLAALDELEKRSQANPISTQVTLAKATTYVETAAQYSPLKSNSHKDDYRTAYALCEGAKTRFPGSDGAHYCANLQISITGKSLSGTIEEINVPGQAFRAFIQYRNLSELHYRIIAITRDEVLKERKRWARDYNVDREEKFINHFAAKTPLFTGKYTLPNDGDYNNHSLEVKLDPLPEGEYMVLFSSNANFATADNGLAYAFTTISNISYARRSAADGSLEFYVLHRQTGEPIAGVKADVYFNSYNYKTSDYESVKAGNYTTDAQGYFKVPFFKNENRRDLYVNFTWKKDFCSIRKIDNGEYGYGRSIYQYEQVPREWRQYTHFFLDRAIYRPGQTIYFKGLVVKTDGKSSEIVPKQTTTVTLYDVNHQQRGTVTVTTNEYGTFSGTFTAPASGLTGNMQLRDESTDSNISFSVEEYKRPKFEVLFDTLKGTYRLDDKVSAKVLAKAYSGAVIDGAAVKYRVVREARFPFWWWCRWGYYPTSPSMVITHGEGKTDAHGAFTVDFKAIPDPTVDRTSDPTFSYTVYADVTDINGETHSSSTSVLVGYKSLVVSVPMTNINREDKKQADRDFHIQATNLAGQPEPTSGKITVYALKMPDRTFRSRSWNQPDRSLYTQEEYYKLFPYDLYADENNKFKWERGAEVFSLNFNTKDKKTFRIPGIDKWSPAEYVLEISATDKDGQPVKEVSYFTVYAPSSKTVPTPVTNYIEEEHTTAEPGETASVVVGTAEKKVEILYEVERDGTILSKEWITLKHEQRRITLPILEEHRGNLAMHLTFVVNNRSYTRTITIYVPYSNKTLDVSFESFRDKLQPGQQEQWKIRIKGKTADKVAAEMVAALYDQSLDAFRANFWYASLFNALDTKMGWNADEGFSALGLDEYTSHWNNTAAVYVEGPDFDVLNWFGYSFQPERVFSIRGARSVLSYSSNIKKKEVAEEEKEMSVAADAVAPEMAKMAAPAPAGLAGVDADERQEPKKPAKEAAQEEDLSAVKARTNFNETAFFFPNLLTNEQGEIIVSFTIPEALTRWKMLGFAHTKDLKSGMITNQLVTQKDLMVVPNQPRFFRENDKMFFSAKITSMVDNVLNGQAQLEFFDAIMQKPVTILTGNNNKVQNFTVQPLQSTSLEWSMAIPEGLQALTYRITARAGNVSDGEEMTLPVVTNSMLVTETLPLPIRGKQSKDFRLDKLVDNKSTTLRSHRLTLEFTSNPAWYAVQALPYLMEYPYDCVEQTFSRYYANSLATSIANSSPRIKQVFDTWKNIQPDALLSNLEKNQELKSAILEETPWVLQAQNETQRKRAVGLLFDLNRMANEQARALEKVSKAQTSNGGFTWFPGFPEDRYMTQHIVTGLGHLDVLGVKSIRTDGTTWSMVTRGVAYLDDKIRDDYERLKAEAKRGHVKLEDDNISYFQAQYLYARSYFKDIAIPASTKEAFDYYLGQAKKFWLKGNLYSQGMVCLALHRFGEKTVTKDMIKSFSERALHSEEMGMFWKSEHGYFWYQAPIETQALMIEVYDEVAADTKSVEDLKVWLLKQKQTQDWKTTKATSEACYALLRRGTDLLTSTSLVDITVGGEKVDPAKREDAKVEAGTGYFKTAWQAGEIKPAMGNIHISKKDDGVAWGAIYWQYFEQLDKITSAETPLKLKKDLFKEVQTDRGPVLTPITNATPLQVGDLVKVRIELRSDRTMEYVHLKDMRASALEPVSTLSTYRYQDGLYYYESPRDLAMNFFIGYLPKGTYVFEYALRVSQKGDFSNGVTTIQCMYAPEFSSHSQGIRIEVK